MPKVTDTGNERSWREYRHLKYNTIEQKMTTHMQRFLYPLKKKKNHQ